MYERMNGHSGTTGSPRARSASRAPVGERRAEALALERRVDLGVHEVRPAAAAVVDGEAGERAVEADLVAVLVRARRVTSVVGVVAHAPARSAGGMRPCRPRYGRR